MEEKVIESINSIVEEIFLWRCCMKYNTKQVKKNFLKERLIGILVISK